MPVTEPNVLHALGWDQLSRLMVYLYLFTGLGLTSMSAYLLGMGVVPSLASSGRVPAVYGLLRWPLLLVAIVAAALALYAFLSVMGLASVIEPAYYPRVLV